MPSTLKYAVLGLAGLAAACSGEGTDVVVGSANISPVAAFSSSCANLTCTFNDSSSDADGRIAAHHWSFGDASADVATRDAEHTYAAPGSFTVVLMVTDDSGATASATSVVRAFSARNISPVAAFGSSCAYLACSFSDSSSDADGRIVGYRWSFGDGSAPATTQDAEHIYAAAGTYIVALTVTDDSGATASFTREVSGVERPNAPPVPSFGASCVGLTCAFSDASSDPDGSVVGHHWLFGDGEASDVQSPAHTYAAAGLYRVELAVTDDRGATARATQELTVTSPLPRGPAIAFSDNAIGFCFFPTFTRACVLLEEQVRFTSTGAKALKWTAVSDQPWIVVQPASGTTPTDVRIFVDLEKLPPRHGSNSVSGFITVSAAGAVNSPQTIPVKLQFYSQPLPR